MTVESSQRRWGWKPLSAAVPSGQILICVPGMLVKQWEEEAHRCLDDRYWNILVYPASGKLHAEFWELWDKDIQVAKQRNQATLLIMSYSVCDLRSCDCGRLLTGLHRRCGRKQKIASSHQRRSIL